MFVDERSRKTGISITNMRRSSGRGMTDEMGSHIDGTLAHA
jgi:hypothetical protein